MKKPKNKYLVVFSEHVFYETWAVSEKQALNNVKYKLGYAGNYKYHECKPERIELIYEGKEN